MIETLPICFLVALCNASPADTVNTHWSNSGRARGQQKFRSLYLWKSQMPEISQEHSASVAILYRIHRDTGREIPIGTAFIVRFRESITEPVAHYLVSCRHCIKESELVRFSNGLSKSIRSENWKPSPSDDDVAAMDVTDLLRKSEKPTGFVEFGSMVREHYEWADVGSDLFMLGLFVNEDTAAVHHVPRARFGNISAIADQRVPVLQGHDEVRPSHLGDMRSRAGFSGSPVFVYRMLSGAGALVQETKWLGVHSGQYPDRIKIHSGGRVYDADIPASMTIIVPAWTLQFIEDDLDFAAARSERDCGSARP